MKPTGETNGSRSDRQTTRQIDIEIAQIREYLSVLVAELDRRRHDLLDVRTQARHRAGALTAIGVALAGAVSTYMWLATSRRRRDATARASRIQ